MTLEEAAQRVHDAVLAQGAEPEPIFIGTRTGEFEFSAPDGTRVNVTVELIR